MSKKKLSRASRLALWAGVVLVWAAALGGGTFLFKQHLTGLFRDMPTERQLHYAAYMRQGRELRNLGRPLDASAYFKKAIEAAPTLGDRYDAGIEVGRSLLAVAQRGKKDYALMARQYFEAAADGATNEVRRLSAYRGLIETAALLDDLPAVRSACRRALEVALDPNERAELVLLELDVAMRIGTWGDVRDLLDTAEPSMHGEGWEQVYAYKKALFDERTLLDDDWFAEYAKQFPDEDPAMVRTLLLDETAAAFKDIARAESPLTRDDCLFRVARLYGHEGQFERSQDYIQLFLENEPTTHLDEIMLLLVRMARVEGEARQAEGLISLFIKRYRVGTQAIKEFRAVVEMLVDRRQYGDALRLMTDFLSTQPEGAESPELLAEAARLANLTGRYEEADAFFDAMMKKNPGPTLLSAALLEQARACIVRNDLAAAQRWLVKFINTFPADPRRPEAIYDLFEIKDRSKASATEVILLGIAAVDSNPDHPRAVDTLNKIARKLEEIGLLDLAQRQYNKVSLLNVSSLVGGEADEATLRGIGEAMLGNARCLLRMGQALRADHLLRELCNNFRVEPVRSEAAYWWAAMALDEGQLAEARRRLALANENRARPEIAAKIQFERNLLDIGEGTPVSDTIDAMIARMADLPPDEYGDFMRRAYRVYFERLMAARDVASMQKLLDYAVRGAHARELPLRLLFLQAASVVAEDRGMPGLLAFIRRNEELLKAAGGGLSEEMNRMAGSIEEVDALRARFDDLLDHRVIDG